MRPIALLTTFFLLAPTVLACDLNVRANTTELPSSIQWDRYVGALGYLVTESSDDFVNSRTYEVPASSFTIPSVCLALSVLAGRAGGPRTPWPIFLTSFCFPSPSTAGELPLRPMAGWPPDEPHGCNSR